MVSRENEDLLGSLDLRERGDHRESRVIGALLVNLERLDHLVQLAHLDKEEKEDQLEKLVCYNMHKTPHHFHTRIYTKKSHTPSMYRICWQAWRTG